MTDTVQTPAAPPVRLRKVYPLRDLGVAPENLRFGEPPDDDIPQLAKTILAAGVLQPLTVRPGRKREKPAMALDGRRRLFALANLVEAGAIDDAYPVEVFEETDPSRQAATAVLTNTAAPVHVADVIAAIGKMLKARLTPAGIAGALGYAELEIRRLAALSGLHPRALAALKAGRLTLKQAKLLARLNDRPAQAEIAERVLAGYAFPEHRVSETLDEAGVTLDDRRWALVGPARYAAAGGRVEADLFGERPDVLLDPDLLDQAWRDRAVALAEVLAGEGRTLAADTAPEDPWPDDLDLIGGWPEDLDTAQMATWRAAREAADRVGRDVVELGAAETAADAAIAAFLLARLAAAQTADPPRAIQLIVLRPHHRLGIDLRCFAPPRPEPDAADAPEAAEAASDGGPGPAEPTGGAAPVAAAAPAEVEGVNHALHEVRTDVATRALIRALADDPAAALAAVTARLFEVLVLHVHRTKGAGALTVAAEPYGRPRTAPIAALDGAVRARLAERRAAWRESGQSPIAWVAGLAAEDRLGLLAELVALSLDLQEARTNALRPEARAQAAELAALCGAEVTRHWTPDAAFLRAHGKAQLLAMLGEMQADLSAARGLKKEALVSLVAEQAAARTWAPAYLSWRGPAAPEPSAIADS